MQPCSIRLVSAGLVRSLLDFPSCAEVIRQIMPQVSAGEALLPLRQGMPIPNGLGVLGMMPGFIDGAPGWFGIKLVSLFPGNPARGLSSHLGLFALYEAESGTPLALLEAGSLTAIRTAAASVVATESLARPEAETLLIVGAGEQAEHHLRAFAMVRPFPRVRLWARNGRAAASVAEKLARESICDLQVFDSLEEAAAGADVICTVTSAREPVLTGNMLSPGMHLCLVGSSFPDRREVDDDVVAAASFFVDYRGSAFAQAGELLHAIKSGRVDKSHVRGEIGEVLSGACEGRASPEQVTVYKSLGVAAQDLGAARLVFERASAKGLGTVVSMG